MLPGHVEVDAAARDELVVAPGFDDAALVHDEDLIAIGDGAEAVADENDGAVLFESAKRFDDEGLVLGIEGAGRFVEDEDGGLGEQSAGDADALALTPGEIAAAFVDQSLVFLGEFIDEDIRARDFRGVADLREGGLGAAVGYVFLDCRGKNETVLKDQRNVGAEVDDFDFAEVILVEADGA